MVHQMMRRHVWIAGQELFLPQAAWCVLGANLELLEVLLVFATHVKTKNIAMEGAKQHAPIVLLEKYPMKRKLGVNDQHGHYQEIVNQKHNTLMIRVL